MELESGLGPRPGSSLTAESSATGHSTATHKHKSPMRRFMNGLKRLNSYSNEQSDSSSSEDERGASEDGQDGSEEFVERHQVQEIRFNYESLSLSHPRFRDLRPKYQAYVLERNSFLPSPNASSNSVHPPTGLAHNLTTSQKPFSSTIPYCISQESW